MHHLLTSVVRSDFLKNVGKWQRRSAEPKAMLVSFNTPINHDIESGYRYLDLLIFAPHNYVQVWVRERWTVIPLDDLEDGDDGGIKPGKDYIEGKSEWKMIADHDSGWTEGVENTFRDKRLLTFSGLGDDWYQVVKLSDVNLPTK